MKHGRSTDARSRNYRPHQKTVRIFAPRFFSALCACRKQQTMHPASFKPFFDGEIKPKNNIPKCASCFHQRICFHVLLDCCCLSFVFAVLLIALSPGCHSGTGKLQWSDNKEKATKTTSDTWMHIINADRCGMLEHHCFFFAGCASQWAHGVMVSHPFSMRKAQSLVCPFSFVSFLSRKACKGWVGSCHRISQQTKGKRTPQAQLAFRIKMEESKSTRDGIRTRNLLLRREAPYPLGHTSNCTHKCPPSLPNIASFDLHPTRNCDLGLFAHIHCWLIAFVASATFWFQQK